ncbi:hypothetical protein OEZ85_002027 [Tetradesmus obliquus]|uniref:Adenosylmethionine decarboxylase n=1 Tax=Tetradesmus obliquus TaxID=3088 RepID=A0ABY8U6S3_TETOB|nr:hypothetical protein OEZ85_002027 [Tetradesmus obliquus]
MTYLGHSCHVFAGTQGVTCVFLLSESHLSLHTWPEHHYAALDIFTCGKAAHPEVMEQGLRELLQPGLVLRQQLARGGLELDKLSPEQRKAKVLHTFITNGQDGESLGQVLHQVPILHSSASRYQSITVIEVPGYDVVIIDSTDFTFAAASKLHSEAFYAALHALMRPQAALIQIVEIYMRVFEQDFAKMESALRSAGWQGVGRSSVFVPSYSGEALMLHAVKH